MTNIKKIKEALAHFGVRQWELADRLGVREDYLSRRMRYEISNETTTVWLKLIESISNEREVHHG